LRWLNLTPPPKQLCHWFQVFNMSKFNGDEFKKLQKKWYDTIARTPGKNGQVFTDIEDTTLPSNPLKSWHNMRFILKDQDQMAATKTYYEQAQSLLHQHKFKNNTHYRIWELHCGGASRRRIQQEIKDMRPTYKGARISEIILEIAKFIKGESHGNSSPEEV
jgi:hypothetical protein